MKIQNYILDYDNLELQEKYSRKYKHIREIIIKEFKLRDVENWKIHYGISASVSKLTPYLNMPIADYKKGYYDPASDTISISDWAFKQPDNFVLVKIILHEMLHANGYKRHDKRMAIAMDNMMKQFKRKYIILQYTFL